MKVKESALRVGPCSCCGEQTPYVSERQDEDSWYYCQTCVDIAAKEEAMDAARGA